MIPEIVFEIEVEELEKKVAPDSSGHWALG